jgi:hypothetical protein
MSDDVAAPKKRRPSERWTSFDDLNDGGMKQRLQGFMASINKTALIEHASAVLGLPASMSEPFLHNGRRFKPSLLPSPFHRLAQSHSFL